MANPSQPSYHPIHAFSPSSTPPESTAPRFNPVLSFFHEHYSNDIARLANALQVAAIHLQQAVGLRGRVHCFYEAINENGHAQVFNLIFSPTVQLDGSNGVMAGSRIAEALRNAAGRPENWISVQNATNLFSRSAVQDTINPFLPPMYRDLTLEWYPGKKKEKNTEWVKGTVNIAQKTYAIFAPMTKQQVNTAYQKLFAKMFQILKPKRTGEKGPLRYARFTPPWLRKNLIIGQEWRILMDTECMPELRNQRNRMGEKRLKAVLAAFYEREPLARIILERHIHKLSSSSRQSPNPSPSPQHSTHMNVTVPQRNTPTPSDPQDEGTPAEASAVQDESSTQMCPEQTPAPQQDATSGAHNEELVAEMSRDLQQTEEQFVDVDSALDDADNAEGNSDPQMGDNQDLNVMESINQGGQHETIIAEISEPTDTAAMEDEEKESSESNGEKGKEGEGERDGRNTSDSFDDVGANFDGYVERKGFALHGNDGVQGESRGNEVNDHDRPGKRARLDN